MAEQLNYGFHCTLSFKLRRAAAVATHSSLLKISSVSNVLHKTKSFHFQEGPTNLHCERPAELFLISQVVSLYSDLDY